MLNGHFRIAVAIRIGVNPFRGVSPSARCSWCKHAVGEDLFSHTIECLSARKGDNNRRHQWLQQVIANLLKSVAQGAVHLVPQVLAFFGSGAHECGHPNPVTARARPAHHETVEQNSRRQGDIGIVDVLEKGQMQLIDLTVSDGGGCQPKADYKAGTLCALREKEKFDTYSHKDLGRFSGIASSQLAVLSFDCMGGMTGNTADWISDLIDALADVSPEPKHVIAARVWSFISVALQKSLANNALSFRNGKLESPAHAVGQERTLTAEDTHARVSASAGPKKRGSGSNGHIRSVSGIAAGSGTVNTNKAVGATGSLQHPLMNNGGGSGAGAVISSGTRGGAGGRRGDSGQRDAGTASALKELDDMAADISAMRVGRQDEPRRKMQEAMERHISSGAIPRVVAPARVNINGGLRILDSPPPESELEEVDLWVPLYEYEPVEKRWARYRQRQHTSGGTGSGTGIAGTRLGAGPAGKALDVGGAHEVGASGGSGLTSPGGGVAQAC